MTRTLLPVGQPGPPWVVREWLNSAPLQLADMAGRVVVLHAFQMLCPGCVIHGIPQAQRLQRAFEGRVQVVGLHSVFEHHDAMQPVSLRAFAHEFNITFPIGVDEPGTDGPVPQTMRAYQMRGTPSLVIFDRRGVIRYHAFGRPDDLEVGAVVGGLVAELTNATSPDDAATVQRGGCDEDACETPPLGAA